MTQDKVALSHLQSFRPNGELLISVIFAWVYYHFLIANEIVSKGYVVKNSWLPAWDRTDRS